MKKQIEQRKPFKIIYLAAGKAKLNFKDVTYNDLDIERDLTCDMLDVNLDDYDFLIATPPCNYWSRANCNINSEYSQKTKHLLPSIINKFIKTGKPFIIENVINKKRMGSIVTEFPYKYIEHGRHCYFTNIMTLDVSFIEQIQDFKYGGRFVNKGDDRQGGSNVNNVLNYAIAYYLGTLKGNK